MKSRPGSPQPIVRRAGPSGLILALAVAAGLALLGLVQLHWWSVSPPDGMTAALPPVMYREEIVTTLSRTLEGATVSAGDPTEVRLGSLEPGFKLKLGGRRRNALIAPPPAAVRYAVRVPPSSALRFAIGVAGDGKRDPDASGVRFAVRLDGQEVFARVVNPAATRSDRRWFDEQVPLQESGNGSTTTTIELVTTAVDPSRPPAGLAGWSHLRIVREATRRRQLAATDAPNVLLLLVDTLRADRLGVYGARPSPSPTLDRLAREGLVFDQAIAQAPWTLPSVASIFTGLHPRSHGVTGRSPTARDGTARAAADPHYLSDRLQTIATLAQAAGITTVGVSANPLVSHGTNLARGFETFLEFGALEDNSWRRAEDVNSAFLDWLQRNRRYRFFGYLHYMDTHGPYVPPAAHRPPVPDGVRRRVARGDVHRLPQLLAGPSGTPLSPEELSYLQALYDAEIRYWDAQLAVLLDGIRAAGLAEETLIVMTSDHGEEFMEHGGLNHGRHLYDEVLRVPLIVAGVAGQHGRIARQVEGIDLNPTVLGLLGVETPSDLPGRDALGGGVERSVISETRRRGRHGDPAEMVAVRTPAWKLIYTEATKRFELYDLRTDPEEQHDRFATAAEGAELVEELDAWKASAARPPEITGQDPAFADKLRALGYIENGTEADDLEVAP